MKKHLLRQIQSLFKNNSKSKKKRLSFASHKKGFLKNNKHIEILYLDGEKPVKKKIKLKKPVFYTSLSFGMVAILLFIFSFSIGVEEMKVGVIQFLGGLGIYTTEIKNVEIQSNDYNNPGSWHIDKSAEWIKNEKARVTFNLKTISKKASNNYSDIILVIDNSGSMAGEKMDQVIEGTKELVNTVLEDNNNQIALITFNSVSTILSSFTNSKEDLLDYLDSIEVMDSTNYNEAFLKVDKVMSHYQPQSNRDLIVLFLTDGEPNIDFPVQVATYHILKDKYPYMTINGIQYEMGKNLKNEIKEVSDYQWIAYQDTIRNVLFKAAIPSDSYEEFIITDYIEDDFIVNSEDDIKVNYGTVSLGEESGRQKILWNLGSNTFYSGMNAKMTINLSLKTGSFSEKGFMPTNEKEAIVSKLSNDSEKTVNSTNTPVLKNNFFVYYEANAPTGCTVTSPSSENHYVFDEILKIPNDLVCSGYLFQGWEVDEEDNKDINYINSDTFIMPGHDVHIKGIWTRQGVNKSMAGEVHQKSTLYKVLEQAATVGTYAKEYTGTHQDSMDASLSTEKIYHWYASNATKGIAIHDIDNVIFANQCWEMIRTTDTGGVKLIYNGQAENNQCLSTRSTHNGYSTYSSQNLASNYWYGTDYTFDNINKVYTLSGDLEEATWDATTGPSLIGKYTCKKTTSSDTCTTLYLVESYNNTTSAYVIVMSNNSPYPIFGYLKFNAALNSIADVGYMYNTRSTYKTKGYNATESILSSAALDTTIWYADSVTWGSPVTDIYNLDNPYQVSDSADYPNLVGKYTFRNTDQTYTNTSVFYIAGVSGSNMYYIQLGNSGNHTLADFDKTYTYGDSYTDNGDGTYTINNPTTVYASNWASEYTNLKDKYICKNTTNNTCSNLWYAISTSITSFDYSNVTINYKYAKGFSWDGEKYILDNDTAVTFFEWNNTNSGKLNNAHYTCFNLTGECSSVSYVFVIETGRMIYINLTGGKDIETALDEMLNVNRVNSVIKSGVEAWYKHYLLEYDDYIEDTVFCNDRTISYLYGWNPDGGSLGNYLRFRSLSSSNLSCPKNTDQFSISNNDAKLTYKVGLMSSPELTNLGNNNAKKIGYTYWTMTPSFINIHFNEYQTNSAHVQADGSFMTYLPVTSDYGVRPAISLKPGIEYFEGDGSKEYPYRIDLDD